MLNLICFGGGGGGEILFTGLNIILNG